MSTRTAVIIGAGVTGLSTAYQLARKNYGRIIVLDKGPVGDGSSSRAAGIITGLMWSEASVLARKISLELFHALSRDLDGYQFQAVGTLNLHDPPSWPERAAALAMYDDAGAPYEILTPREIEQRWPTLCVRRELTGILDPSGGYSEPHDYVPALARKLVEMGVEIRENTTVDGFLRDGQQVTGVRTVDGDIAADAVVAATYAWSLTVLDMLGRQVPIKTFVHQRYVTTPLPTPPDIPAVNAHPYGGYIRPAHGGRLLVGIETSEREEHKVASSAFHLNELHTPETVREEARQYLGELFPPLLEAEWEYDKVGLITFAVDGEPLVGPLAGLPGVFLATAFQSGGFAYNPVVGLLTAEMVCGEKTSVDVSGFSPDRFDAATTAEYLGHTIQQKDAVRRRH